MKKILLVAIVLVCMGASQNVGAQKGDLKDIDHLSFYGVDFTYAKVYGADETAHQFLDAFIRINDLFESEPKAYTRAKRSESGVTNFLTGR